MQLTLVGLKLLWEERAIRARILFLSADEPTKQIKRERNKLWAATAVNKRTPDTPLVVEISPKKVTASQTCKMKFFHSSKRNCLKRLAMAERKRKIDPKVRTSFPSCIQQTKAELRWGVRFLFMAHKRMTDVFKIQDGARKYTCLLKRKISQINCGGGFKSTGKMCDLLCC